jgi:hypothetical protein
MNTQYLIYAGVAIVGIIAGVWGHKWHLSRFVPKALLPIEQEAKTITEDAVHVVEDAFTNGHEAVVAHDYKQASLASDAARVATEVERLILQFAGAANKNVSQLTAPDLQNVIAYVLHSLSPVDQHKVTPKAVVDAHAKLVAAHNTLAADTTFQAAQTAAAYQSSAPVA